MLCRRPTHAPTLWLPALRRVDSSSLDGNTFFGKGKWHVAPAEGTTVLPRRSLSTYTSIFFMLLEDGGPIWKGGAGKAALGAVARYCKEQVRRQNYGFRSFAAVQHEGLALWTGWWSYFVLPCPNGGASLHDETILGLVCLASGAGMYMADKGSGKQQKAKRNITAIAFILSHCVVLCFLCFWVVNEYHKTIWKKSENYSLHHISNDYDEGCSIYYLRLFSSTYI